MPFNPADYGARVAPFLTDAPRAELGPGHADAGRRDALEALDPESLVGGKVADREMALACLAGLWLRFDFLDESHRISQNLASTTGSYWHGILHRREGDFSNAKYWFRQVGAHPTFAALAAEAKRLATESDAAAEAKALAEAESWDPFAFVDLCQQAVDTATPLEALCKSIQEREWELLFDYGYRLAAGAGKTSS